MKWHCFPSPHRDDSYIKNVKIKKHLKLNKTSLIVIHILVTAGINNSLLKNWLDHQLNMPVSPGQLKPLRDVNTTPKEWHGCTIFIMFTQSRCLNQLRPIDATYWVLLFFVSKIAALRTRISLLADLLLCIVWVGPWAQVDCYSNSQWLKPPLRLRPLSSIFLFVDPLNCGDTYNHI